MTEVKLNSKAYWRDYWIREDSRDQEKVSTATILVYGFGAFYTSYIAWQTSSAWLPAISNLL